MAENVTGDRPPMDGVDALNDPNFVPPVDHRPVVSVETPATSKQDVEVTRIPQPTVVGKSVIFPQAHGVDYTVDDKVLTGVHPLKGDMKVKAVARKGYRFAKGQTQTFNLKG